MSEERAPKQIIEDEVHEYYLSHVRIGHEPTPYVEGIHTLLKADLTEEEYQMLRKMGVKSV